MAAALLSAGQDPSAHRWLVVPRHASAAPRLLREARRTLGPDARLEHRFGVLRSWYGVADLAFVGGGACGRGVHDLLEPLALGRRPLFFADRGDPGSVGETLSERGLALRLDGPRPGAAAAGLAVPPQTWALLRARFDGRDATVDFLVRRGVLPDPGLASA